MHPSGCFVGVGAPGGIRTPDQWLRKPLLYPAELRARGPFQASYRPQAAILADCAGPRERPPRLDTLAGHERSGPAVRTRVAPAPAPVLATDPRRPADRLVAAALADVVGPVAGRRWRAAAVAAGGFQSRRVADPLGRLRDQRLRRPLAGPRGRAHPRTPAGHRRGLRARSAGGVRGADAGGVRAG